MKKYKAKLAFYQSLLAILSYVEQELPHEVGMEAIERFDKVKAELSLPEEFTAAEVKELHENFDVREDYAEAAFRDLAPHLRDPEVWVVVHGFIDRSGTGIDDLYFQVRGVRLLRSGDTNGPAVLTVVVSSFEIFKSLIEKDERQHPEVFHGSIGENAEEAAES